MKTLLGGARRIELALRFRLLFSVPPLSLSCAFGFRIGPKDVSYSWISRPVHYPPSSPLALSVGLAPCPLFEFDLITSICLICVRALLFAISQSLSPSVSPFYIYMRVLGHTVAFIHVCVHRCIVLPVFLVPISLVSLAFPSVLSSGSLVLCLWLISCLLVH